MHSILSEAILICKLHRHVLLLCQQQKNGLWLVQAVEERGAVGNLGSMQFIDFEYGAYSYRGHDWGNHFAEYAGFECDYSRYPDNEHVELFVRAYLNERAHSPAVSVSRRCI